MNCPWSKCSQILPRLQQDLWLCHSFRSQQYSTLSSCQNLITMSSSSAYLKTVFISSSIFLLRTSSGSCLYHCYRCSRSDSFSCLTVLIEMLGRSLNCSIHALLLGSNPRMQALGFCFFSQSIMSATVSMSSDLCSFWYFSSSSKELICGRILFFVFFFYVLIALPSLENAMLLL